MITGKIHTAKITAQMRDRKKYDQKEIIDNWFGNGRKLLKKLLGVEVVVSKM